ncbi:MAG TPA: DMT family transporter [Verrucomicrobiae bacterium]|nr:DMT family transporter [Verrucomicrobiae bacterium]
MNAALLIPFVLGCLAVVQVALNKRIASVIGLTQAVILNAGGLLVVAVLFWLYARGSRNEFGGLTGGSGAFADFQLWWVIPGLCGLTLVAGMPWAAERIGALQTFVVLVAGQMLFSIAWDHFVDDIQVSWPRVAGTGLAILGAFVSTIRS